MVGQQLRIRVQSSRGAKKIRTQVLSERVHRIAGLYSDGWKTQAWRLNLSKFPSYHKALLALISLQLTEKNLVEGNRLLKKWFMG